MGEKTKIAWCDHTFNPWIGCTKIALGCVNCYAEDDFYRRRGKAKWGTNGTRVLTSHANWKQPIRWNRKAEEAQRFHGEYMQSAGKPCERKPPQRPRVFCASLCDVFEDWHGTMRDHHGSAIRNDDGSAVVMNDVRRDLFRLIDATPNLNWLLLTKRPQNIWAKWPTANETGEPYARRNVWLGCSVSTQKDIDAAMPHLLECRDLVPVLFLSLEPLIGPIDLRGKLSHWTNQDGSGSWFSPVPGKQFRRLVDWVIVGGESGPNARPCEREWLESIIRQCQQAAVPMFVKQFGAKYSDGINGVAGHDLRGEFVEPLLSRRLVDRKGGDTDEWPADLRVREFPTPRYVTP